ncbi:MAG: aminoacetone oxidase family FAD-binding enzyme [Clostridia bacterium]|nr:aminoacetone oxidase family FAD-binding enzyme [Clostridia bacterium]
MSDKKTIAVIGGGAAGMTAAIAAARQAQAAGSTLRIRIFESNAQPGKKLLATGNGRCNLSNLRIDEDCYHGSLALFHTVYTGFDREKTLKFFASVGVRISPDGAGRLYPCSRQAKTVADALVAACSHYGAEFLCQTPVDKLERLSDGFLINGCESADAVIFACGGAAAPKFGTNGGAFGLLQPFGIAVTPLLPSLSPIEIRAFPKDLKGIRAAGKLRLYQGTRFISESEGEIQYTEYGLSGIPAMEISGDAAEIADGSASVSVDSMPELSFSDLHRELRYSVSSSPWLTAAGFLGGYLPQKLGERLLATAGVPAGKALDALTKTEADSMIKAAKAANYRVLRVRGFPFAQTTRGGVAAAELVPGTLMLKKLPGAYIAGEMADIDGRCGGYNLQWAWSSGYTAGKAAAERCLGH